MEPVASSTPSASSISRRRRSAICVPRRWMPMRTRPPVPPFISTISRAILDTALWTSDSLMTWIRVGAVMCGGRRDRRAAFRFRGRSGRGKFG